MKYIKPMNLKESSKKVSEPSESASKRITKFVGKKLPRLAKGYEVSPLNFENFYHDIPVRMSRMSEGADEFWGRKKGLKRRAVGGVRFVWNAFPPTILTTELRRTVAGVGELIRAKK